MIIIDNSALYNQINNKEFFLWDAVVAWRDRIYQADFYNNTKGNYLTGMLKLIESGIIDVRLKLKQVDECWANEAKQKIDAKPEWSTSTKTIRKSCLNSFYNFIKTDFDASLKPYRRHPNRPEIKHILSVGQTEALEKVLKHTLSSVQDKALTIDISPQKLCTALSKINERDAYIVWLMMYTGETLENILDFPNMKTERLHPYLFGKYIPDNIRDAISSLCKNSSNYLFETANGKRIRRTQVTRNLKQAGHMIGLDFDLTPKVLHGFVCAYMSRDKRSELEKAMNFSID